MPTVPVKFYVITALLVLTIIGLAIFAWHEREMGALAITTADFRVAAAREVHNAEVESRAKVIADNAIQVFQASQLQPVVVPAPLTRLVCVAPATRAGQVSDHGRAPGGSNGSPALPAESDGPPFNPAPAVLQDAHDADAQIALLQALIRSYQAGGVVKK